MRKLYDKLLEMFNISGRDLAVFLLALLLAFSIWLIHNLSLKYNAYLDVAVKARCNIEGHADLSSDQANVVARCRATGYNVIRSGIKGKRKVVEIEFLPSVMKHKEGDMFYVPSSDLQEYAHMIFGDGVTVEYFATDTLFFRFPLENHKRVPVHPVYTVSYQPQYMNDGNIEMRPDSVTVYGEPHILENISRVYTESFRYVHISDDINGEVRLEPIKRVRFSEDKVHYSLEVTRFVEMKAKLPVRPDNVPADKRMTVFPSTAEVTLKCSFPLSTDPFETVSLKVDYLEYERSLSGKCMVEPEGFGGYVLDYEITPASVECIVEDVG